MHHAYFLEGSREAGLKFVNKFCEEKLCVKTVGNPDFWRVDFETFTIDDARHLKDLQEKKPIQEKSRVFVLSLTFIASEAQNALLKTFEEPTPGTYFFIIASTSAFLLSTLRSRLFIEKLGIVESGATIDAEKFLKSPPSKRLSMIQPLFKEGTEKAQALAFLTDVEVALHEMLAKNKESAESLAELLKLKRYVFDRAPSLKMILEYLSLSLPRS